MDAARSLYFDQECLTMAMTRYLIIERIDDELYAYFEDKKHFLRVMENPSNKRYRKNEVEPEVLNNDCNISQSLRNGQWMRIRVKNSEGAEE